MILLISIPSKVRNFLRKCLRSTASPPCLVGAIILVVQRTSVSQVIFEKKEPEKLSFPSQYHRWLRQWKHENCKKLMFAKNFQMDYVCSFSICCSCNTCKYSRSVCQNFGLERVIFFFSLTVVINLLNSLCK